MTAECVARFRDLEAGVMREPGDRFECAPERLAAINGTRYGVLAVEVEGEQPEEQHGETPAEGAETPEKGRSRASRAKVAKGE